MSSIYLHASLFTCYLKQRLLDVWAEWSKDHWRPNVNDQASKPQRKPWKTCWNSQSYATVMHFKHTFVSFYLLNKMLRNVGIILLVQFSKHLETFSMIWSGIRYIWHKQFGLVFIETPCTLDNNYCLLCVVKASKLQSFLNAAVRLIWGIPKFSHNSSFFRNSIHWLPIRQRIQFKICSLMRKAYWLCVV